jgi:hypothetical protein
VAGERAGVPSNALAAGTSGLMIVGSWRSPTPAWSRSVTSSVLSWLALGVWLTRSLPRYAARNFSIEKTVPRESL